MRSIKTLKHRLLLTTVVLFTLTQLFAQNSFFIKNKGQVFNQEGKFNNDVAYILSLKDYNVSFYSNHFAYEIFSKNNNDSSQLNVDRIELWFNNTTSASFITPNNKEKEVFNVFKNGKAFENIESFQKITYKNIWEGVDIEFQIHNNQLKYNYIISNQKIKSISLNIKGAEVEEKNGEILFKTLNKTLKETIPESYFLLSNDERKKEDVHFKISNNNLIFNLPKNRKKTYIIDPIAYGNQYTSYYGGAHMDFAQNVNTTKTNQVIISGYTVSTTNIATTGAHQTTLSDQDAFIAAFDNQGTRLWATYFGGPDQDRIYTAALDTNDNIFIAGNTTSLIGIATPGAFQQYISSGDDAFMTKFSSTGALIWSSYYGGNAHELITAIEVDNSNKVYITGHTSSSDLTCTPNAFRNSIDGYENAFLGAFDNNGNVIYNSYYIKGSNTRGESISISNNGTIYFSGYTNDTETITYPSVHQTNNNGYIEGFLVKLNPQFQMIWKTYIGGDHNDLIESMAIDSLENIYIVGKTKSSIGIATTNSFQSSYSNNWDGFVIKLDSTCSQLWGTYIQTGNSEEITAIKLKDSSIWFLGIVNGSNFPTNSSALQTNNNGGFDNLIVNLSDTGGLIWSSYLGGTNDEFGYDLTFNNSNNIIITGQTGSNSDITTTNAHQVNYGGNLYDGFWTKLCKPTHPTILSQSGHINLCEGDSINILSNNSFSHYLWSNGDTTNSIYLSIGGEYVLKTKDINNCPGRSDTLTLNIIPHNNINLQVSNSTICHNDSVLLSIPNIYNSYLWNNGDTSSTIYISDNQEYYLTTTNIHGCTFHSDSVQLLTSQYNYPIQLIGDTIICSGGESILYTSGLNSINWNSLETSNSITVDSSGNYWFTGSDTNNCPAISDTISITQINYNSPTLILDTNSYFSICWNDSIQLSAENNFISYLWSNGDTTQIANLSQEGFYYVSATDSNGCVGISDSIKIEYKTLGISNIIQTQGNEFCEKDSLLLLTQLNLSNIEWNLNNINDDSLYILTGGNYYYSAIDSLGCSTFSDTITIFENNTPDVQIIGGEDTICIHDSLYLSNISSLNTYLWSNNIQNSTNYYTLDTLGTNIISLIGTDINNCTSSDSIRVTVIDCAAYDNIYEEANYNIEYNIINNQLFINSPIEIKDLTLIDLNGKIIFQKENIGLSSYNIDSENITPSLYLLKIELIQFDTIIIKKVNLIK